jgi:putative two-component system response regulator
MTTTKLKEKTVLIVDDEELMRRAIKTKLTKEGYRCSEASCANEALAQLSSEAFNLVILDIKMPGRPGNELLPEIRSKYPDTAVIMATAVIDPPTIVKCMKDGAHDYIPKPFEFNELMLAVGNALVKNRIELELKFHMNYLEHTVDDQGRQIRKLTLGSFEALVMALEAKDEYTAGHSRRVVRFAEAIALEMMLCSEDMDDLHWGALLHDIGKIAVDPHIQNKPETLSKEEYRHIMIHSQIGPSIVEPVANKGIQSIIQHHHDRYDGTGYGQEVAGDNIPMGARIVAVADTFDAMTSDRPYRKALTVEESCEEIAKCSGTQFDPNVVKAFLNICHHDSMFMEGTLG